MFGFVTTVLTNGNGVSYGGQFRLSSKAKTEYELDLEDETKRALEESDRVIKQRRLDSLDQETINAVIASTSNLQEIKDVVMATSNMEVVQSVSQVFDHDNIKEFVNAMMVQVFENLKTNFVRHNTVLREEINSVINKDTIVDYILRQEFVKTRDDNKFISGLWTQYLSSLGEGMDENSVQILLLNRVKDRLKREEEESGVIDLSEEEGEPSF